MRPALHGISFVSISASAALTLAACGEAQLARPVRRAPGAATGRAPAIADAPALPSAPSAVFAAAPGRASRAADLARLLARIPGGAGAAADPAAEDAAPPAETHPADAIGEVRYGALFASFAGQAGTGADAIVRQADRRLTLAFEALQLTDARGDVLVSQQVSPVDGVADALGSVRYAEAFDGVDLTFALREQAVLAGIAAHRLPDLFASDEAADAAWLELVERITPPAGAELLYADAAGALRHAGAPFELETDRPVGFGAGETPWFYVPAPFAVDAAGAEAPVRARIRLCEDGAAEYVTRVPAAWLRDAARAWPIVVDPPVLAGAPVPFVSTAHLDRLPTSGGDVTLWLSMTGQDAARSSSDLTMTWRVRWDDGSETTDLAPGPGARVATHTYAAGADPCGADGICAVSIETCDILGRCTSETLTYPIAGGFTCRYTCLFDAGEEILRSFFHRVSECGACEADIAARCSNPPDVASACDDEPSPPPAGAEPPAGMMLWLAADEGTSETAGRLSGWQDLSGNGNHMVGPSLATRHPVLEPAAVNGLPAVRFDGAQFMLSQPLQLFSTPSSGLTTFVVFRSTQVPGQKFLLNHGAGYMGTNTNFELGYSTGFGTAGNYGIHGGSSRASVTAGGTVVANGWSIFATTVAGSGGAPGNVTLYKDGTALATQAHAGGWLSAGAYQTDLAPLEVGCRVDGNWTQQTYAAHFTAGGDSCHRGHVAEVLVYPSALDATGRAAVEAYLSDKYAIPTP